MKQKHTSYLMLLPFGILVAMLVVLPLIVTGYIATAEGLQKTAPESLKVKQTILGGLTREVVKQTNRPVVTQYNTVVYDWSFVGLDNFFLAANFAKNHSESDDVASIPIQGNMIDWYIEWLNVSSFNELTDLASLQLERLTSIPIVFALLVGAAYTIVTLPLAMFMANAIVYIAILQRSRYRNIIVMAALIPIGVPSVIGTWVIFESGIAEAIISQFVRLSPDSISTTVELFVYGCVLALSGLWRSVPILFLILYAGRSMVPRAVFDATRIDGPSYGIAQKTAENPHMRKFVALAVVSHVVITTRDVESLLALNRHAEIYSVQSLAIDTLSSLQGSIGYPPLIAAFVALMSIAMLFLCLPWWRTMWRAPLTIHQTSK